MPEPETSTVREALAIVSAVEQIAAGADNGRLVDLVEQIIESGRQLRPHQVSDVLAHLRDRYHLPVWGPDAEEIPESLLGVPRPVPDDQ
jgi:hypothetical protein